MRHKYLITLLFLSLILAGCDRLPTINFPDRQTPTTAPTLILQPTETPQPTATLPDLPTLEPTPDDDLINDPPQAEIKYTLQEGGPFYLPNFTHPDQGCAWMGVAGQVFDEKALEVLGLTIIAGSDFEVEDSARSATTGQSTAYGLGGYEIILSDRVVTSSQVYWVKVINTQGQPLSEQIFFDTFEDCERNLILVNFVPIQD